MEEERFRVVFTGRIKEGHELEDVRSNLAATFRMDPAGIAKLFTGKPAVVKKQVDKATAEKYRAAFDRAGAICRVEPIPEVPRQSADQPVTAPREPAAAPRPSSTPETAPPPSPPEPTESAPLRVVEVPVAGFWRRTLGFWIDAILLGSLGHLLGFFFHDRFAAMGSAGSLIGFSISLLYFGLLDSQIARGQTLGKKVVGVRVVDQRGGPLSFAKATGRFIVLAVPIYLNGLVLPFESQVLYYLVALLVFGVGGAQLYLYIFNRRTRQSLHDLAVGSYVVMARPEGTPARTPIWKGHLILAGLWCLIVLVGAAVLPLALLGQAPFAALNETRMEIQGLEGASQVTVVDGTSLVNGNRTTFIRASVLVTDPSALQEDFADKVARIILTTHPDVQEKDRLDVVLSYGFDIGIANRWQNSTYSFTPGEWMERIGMKKL